MRSIKLKNLHLIWDPKQLHKADEHHFSPEWWRTHGRITGESHGRGITYFVKFEDKHWVLRHYLRGGIPARFSRERFLYTRANKTRVWQELELLKKMHMAGLPVPAPVAGVIHKEGITYSASILIERIQGANDLFHALKQAPVSPERYAAIGSMIRRFHDAGFYHADLNCHNILIDGDNKIWLIDFDRGELKRPQEKWQKQNMERLRRSFRKEVKRNQVFHWQEQDWQHLLEGYQGAD